MPDNARRSRRDAPEGGLPTSQRRQFLKASGLFAAAGAGAAVVRPALAQDAAAPPFATVVTPRYYPLDGFVPELSLAGKVAVITGASRGLGLATGLALQAEGVTVIGTSRIPAFYPNHPFPLLTLDITVPESVEAFAAELGAALNGEPIDILINNAGRFVIGTALPLAPALSPSFESQTQLGMETLYVGHVRVTNRLLPMMSQSGYARLLYTVSVAGYTTGGSPLLESYGGSFFSAYYSGKRALLAYANNLRGFLRVSGSPIKVSTVNPTAMNTVLAEGLHPIYLEPVDASGNSANPYMQAALDGMRGFLASGLPPSFVGQTYAQLLQLHEPPPNVVTGSRVEPYATQGGSALLEQSFLEDNAESALPLGPQGAGI